jgi:2'-5' RNA ligase
MRSNQTEPAKWGSLALVSYIPDPLGAFLHNLQGLLPGEHNPRPHVTILPPRPLKTAVETASREARAILQEFPSFDVELLRIRRFPETNILYLNVGEGEELLRALHGALNAGDLAHAERFEFLPHLTLGGPVPDGSLADVRQHAESAWGSATCPARFHLSEVVCLWSAPASVWGNWQRVWSQSLAVRNATAVKVPSAAAITARTY